MNNKQKFNFIYTDKILNAISVKDDMRYSDFQGVISAIVDKMYIVSRNWTKAEDSKQV